MSAGRHVGAAEIVDHVDTESVCHGCAVAELPGLSKQTKPRRAMQHGLAVETDRDDVSRRDVMDLEELRDRLGLCRRQGGFRLGEDGRFRSFEPPGLSRCNSLR